MREHINADEQFVREDVTVDEALERFRGEGQDYKVELIEDLVARRPGASRPSASTRTAPSPTSAAARTAPARSASRRSSCSPSPARTGAATPTASSSRASTAPRSSPRRSSPSTSSASSRPSARDHRKLGKELELFMFSRARARLARSGCPPGTAIWNELSELCREREPTAATREVKTPMLYDVELWKQSGHWDKYRENMFFTRDRGPRVGPQADELPRPRPPLQHERRSYRDLPIRYSEPGLLHRHEPSGTLHGLLRVRHFTQDDAHIFCSEEQVQDEVGALPGLRLRHLRRCSASSRTWSCRRARAAGRRRRAVGPRRGRAAAGARRRARCRTRSTRATAPSTARRSTCT